VEGRVFKTYFKKIYSCIVLDSSIGIHQLFCKLTLYIAYCCQGWELEERGEKHRSFAKSRLLHAEGETCLCLLEGRIYIYIYIYNIDVYIHAHTHKHTDNEMEKARERENV
jgi:hypothetical protein